MPYLRPKREYHKSMCPCSSYKDSVTASSSIDFASSGNSSLFQKWNKSRQFILIFLPELYLSSKYLEFLSFHIVHYMLEGTIFHLFFCAMMLARLFQHANSSLVDSFYVLVVSPNEISLLLLSRSWFLHSSPISIYTMFDSRKGKGGYWVMLIWFP